MPFLSPLEYACLPHAPALRPAFMLAQCAENNYAYDKQTGPS